MNFWYDQATDTLVYPLTAGAPLHALPEAKQINGQFFAVPAKLAALQTLRYYNYPVPEAMTGYDWPIKRGWKALAHQKVMANFMVLHRRCFNLSDPGTMKTMAALWAADWLMRQHPKGSFRALIVAPLSILERTWVDAIADNLLGRRTFDVLHGSAQKRINILQHSNADFLIVNFDGVGIGSHVVRRALYLDGFAKVLAERDDIKLAIVDEATAYKDAQTKRHRLARLIFGEKPCLWLMTGTPTPQAPTDAYGLGKLVNKAFGKSFTTFRNETMMQVSQYKWMPRRDGYEQARKLLTPAIRFAIEDVWDGPEMTVEQRQVELTPEQKKALLELKRDVQLRLKDGTMLSVPNEAALRSKFLQIVQGEVYDGRHNTHSYNAGPRVRELLDLITTSGGKCLVFSSLTSIVNMLYDAIRKHWTCEIVNGATTLKERSRIFKGFQDEASPHVIVADPGTMAHGIDLFRARRTIWFGPTDKTELYLQANRRMHRPGQQFPSSVVQIVSTQLEREIYTRLQAHQSMQGALLDSVRKGEF
jgi:SNF2 family DNA or RNA helicase